MLEILHQYLIQNKSLSLPGLGTLQLQYIPAISNFSDHVILPPMHKVIFDDMQDTPGKSLFQYVASKMCIEEWEAIKKINDFSYELKSRLKEKKSFEWHKIGILSYDEAGNIVLDSQTISYGFMQPVHAVRVIRADASHLILRGDTEVSGSFLPANIAEEITVSGNNVFHKWWFWAAVLAIVSFVLLAFHFYNNGFSVNSLHNMLKTPFKNGAAEYKQM
ncbi:MAG: hypothetical protein J0H29_23585 [Sphingobacteriales bacterium]|nr:hypothetical protein [Sphingobacteriales bacterium]OJY81837.1 MAG: hypothetical protein BGP14_03495 [Sphingobacteriales bacterium 44-15]